jgi:putative transposase
MPRPSKPANPFRYFNSSPEVIRLVVMMYVRFPLSLRNVEDLLFERGIDISHETVRYWSNRFGPMFAADIRRQRVSRRCQSKCTWYDCAAVRPVALISPLADCGRSLPKTPRNWALSWPLPIQCICSDRTA